MKFIDETKVKVKAGKGGDGVISFRREFRVDRGGPDGGDGGHGGSVYFCGESGMNTLVTLKFQANIIGNDGTDGKRKKMYGAKGENLHIKVPLGTLVYDGDNLIHDITEEKDYLIAKGGKGGRGNVKFKTARNTAPRLSEKGEKGEKFELNLVLKVLADIGFVGLPSAGKSTLLSKISNAKPKIADYPFTTLVPQLGIVNVDNKSSFVAADLPGLIEKASEGKGLGIEFLKHIDRCRVIAHIIDFGSADKDPVHDYQIINKELKNYSLGLEKRDQVIIANKEDNEQLFKINYKKFQKKYPAQELIAISALEEKNLSKLKFKLNQALISATPIIQDAQVKEVTISLEKRIIIDMPFKGMYEISGREVQAIYDKIPLTSWENFQRFNSLLGKAGLWIQLREKGVKDGDVIRVFGYEFQWSDEEF